jgi:uncharacterized cupredoxin-like copper-binding protein
MRRLAAPCALLLALAGCGGGDDAKPTRTVTTPAGGTLDVSAHEYSFDPNRVEVGGAGAVKIVLRNDGDLAHDIRLERAGRDVGGTQPFPGGETKSVSLRLEPGTYKLLCSVGDHADLGMTGKLTVK